jgi:AhpD family alkylhydroperoxidase
MGPQFFCCPCIDDAFVGHDIPRTIQKRVVEVASGVDTNDEELSQERIGEYIFATVNEYKEGLGWYAKQNPSVMDSYLKFTEACFEPGSLSEKDKHLIALAAVLQRQDEYCISYHATRAFDCGATDRELLEVIAVCSAVGGGSSMTQGVTLLRDVIESRTTTH